MSKILYSFFLFTIAIQASAQSYNRLQLGHYFDSLTTTHKAMGNVAIRQQSKLTYTHSFGYSNVLLRKKANPETLYRLGASPKLFLSVMIMQLAEAGKLELHTTIHTLIPRLEKHPKVSIDTLLTGKEVWSTTELETRLPSSFQNTSSTSRSSTADRTNLKLLRLILKEVEQQKFSQIFKTHIHQKAKLNRAQVLEQINFRNNEALPYVSMVGNWKPASPTKGHPEIAITAKELARFMEALFKGGLVNTKHLDRLKTGGYGLNKMSFHQKTAYWFQTNSGGFQSIAAYFPKDNVSFALCVNASQTNLKHLFNDVMNRYYGYR